MENHQGSDMSNKSIVEFGNELFQANDINTSPNESTRTTCTNLQQMNEYCLRKVFKIRSLDLMDLVSLAETCKVFRRITQDIVPKNIEANEYCEVFDVEFGSSGRRTRKDLLRIFKNFGWKLCVVTVIGVGFNPNNGEPFLLQLVTEHCDKTNLKSLSIGWIQITEIFTVKLEPIFKKLQTLDLNVVHMTGCMTSLFAKLDSLVELRVRWVANCSAILGNIFPKLKCFDYRKERVVMTERVDYLDDPDRAREQTLAILTSFIHRHECLKKLELTLDCDDLCRANILQAIGDSCKELQELSVGITKLTATHLLPLQTIKSLRTLKLWGLSLEDLEFFSPMAELRELHLNHCNLPNNYDQFACLNQLTILKWEHNAFHSDFSIYMIQIISRLTNLKEFQIKQAFRYFELDEETFGKIVGIVKGRPNVLTLKCNHTFYVTNYEENRRVTLLGLDSNSD